MGRLGRTSCFAVNGSVDWSGGVNKEDMNYHSGKGINYSCMFEFYVRIQEDDVFALENFTTGSETCQNDWDIISFTRRTTRWNCTRSYVFAWFQTFLFGSHGRFGSRLAPGLVLFCQVSRKINPEEGGHEDYTYRLLTVWLHDSWRQRVICCC